MYQSSKHVIPEQTFFKNSIRATQNIVSNHTSQDDGHI